MGENRDTIYDALEQSAIVRECALAFREATGLGLTLDSTVSPNTLECLGDKSAATVRRSTNRPGDENPFCTLMSTNEGSCDACLKTQMKLHARLQQERSPQEACCFAGLSELAVPVILGGRHVATLRGGQVFHRKPTRRQFNQLRRQLLAWGMTGELPQVKQAFFHTPVVPKRRFHAALGLLKFLARHLAEHAGCSLIAAQRVEPSPVTEAKTFVYAHANERIRLRLAAEHVHLSAFHFCKVFKKATGMTFTEFVARVRVEKAKTLLCDLRIRVTEVALGAGFGSVSQFNRTFRRYAGNSPTAYRALFHV